MGSTPDSLCLSRSPSISRQTMYPHVSLLGVLHQKMTPGSRTPNQPNPWENCEGGPLELRQPVMTDQPPRAGTLLELISWRHIFLPTPAALRERPQGSVRPLRRGVDTRVVPR